MRVLHTIGISLVLLTEVGCQSRYFRTNLAGRVYPADYDRNGDGITDIQAIRAGFDPADPTLATQDPDGDGLSNYWEFKLGFDPNKADSDNTKHDKKLGGNGTGDCDEDLVGDGIGVCWKIKNNFKPAEGNRSLTDADGDAYSDGEEFSASTDPNNATSRPGGATVGSDGKLPPVLTIKGTNATYTTSLSITGTMSYCTAGEKILFTSSKTKPGSDDAGFVDCTTTADALVGTLASGAAGNRVMFVWRKIAAGVVDVPLSASILYAVRATAGGLDVQAAGNRTLAVSLVPPSDAHYGTVKLLRFPEYDCTNKTKTSAGSTEVAVNPGDVLVTSSNLPLGYSYCFKAFWTDDKGNEIVAHGGYDGTPPSPGTFAISGYENKTIKFTHTPPNEPKYQKLILRRFEDTSCWNKTPTDGAEVPIGLNDTTYSDANLSYNTNYCYKIFWSDLFGNYSSYPANAGDPAVAYLYANSRPNMGTVALQSLATQSITLSHTPPATATGRDYNDLVVRRFESLTCADKSDSDGTVVTVANKNIVTVADTGLQYNTPYCYKFFWRDSFGNSNNPNGTGDGTVSYSGVPPGPGTISRSLETQKINLSWTNPDDSGFTAATKRLETKIFRYLTASCENKAATEGIVIVTDPVASPASSPFRDGDPALLSLNQNYCYKIFWYDSFGNATTKTTAYSPDSSLSGGDISVDSMTSGKINILITQPTALPSTDPPTLPSQTSLTRFNDDKCLGTGNLLLNAISISTTTHAYADAAGTLNNTYCYKVSWIDAFGNEKSDSVVAKYFPPTFDDITATLNFTANASGTITSGSVSSYIARSFNSIFADTNLSLKPVTANATGSTGAVSASDTDIPFLTYKTASAGSCSASSTPLFCAKEVSEKTPGTTTLNAYTVATEGVLTWNYTKFDQGEYFINTLSRLYLDGQNYVSDPSKGKITVNTGNLGNEEILFSDSGSLTSGFSNKVSWFSFSPTVAISQGASTNTQQSMAIIYPALEGNRNHFLNLFSVERSNNGTASVSSDFDEVYTPDSSSPPTSKSGHQIAATSADTEYSSVVSNAETSAEDAKFIAVSILKDANGNYIQLSSTKTKTQPFAIDRLRLSEPTGDGQQKVNLSNTTLTNAFLDDDSNYRHGMAFSARIGTTSPFQYGIYLTKLRSTPSTSTKSGYLDRTGYFQTQSIPMNTVFDKAIKVKDLGSFSPYSLKIVTGNEGGTNVFYLGWRTIKSSTDEVLNIARVVANGDSSPTPIVVSDAESIDHLTRTGAWGRSTFAIAAGQSNDATPSNVLGVIYSQDTYPARCLFRAYGMDESGNLVKLGSGADLIIDEDITENGGIINDCRFVSLFWNKSLNRFMAVWSQGGPNSFGATYYSDFTYMKSGNSVTKIKQVEVTGDRSLRSQSDKKIICNMGAHYSYPSAGLDNPRIAIVSIEAISGGSSGSDCNNDAADIRLEFYKPGM
ncbi:MAG: hypothetical protein FJ146_06160 [Deltaproteobacteria bacterium]|nr:hypothetical protein [Deltaproteobacteria bacterium]